MSTSGQSEADFRLKGQGFLNFYKSLGPNFLHVPQHSEHGKAVSNAMGTFVSTSFSFNTVIERFPK